MRKLFLARFRYRHFCVTSQSGPKMVTMRPSRYLTSHHLALGAIWVWVPC